MFAPSSPKKLSTQKQQKFVNQLPLLLSPYFSTSRAIWWERTSNVPHFGESTTKVARNERQESNNSNELSLHRKNVNTDSLVRVSGRIRAMCRHRRRITRTKNNATEHDPIVKERDGPTPKQKVFLCWRRNSLAHATVVTDDEPCHFFFGYVCKNEQTGRACTVCMSET